MRLKLSILLIAINIIAASSAKPNIVLLLADDLGYGDLGFTGHPTTNTPNLDALAYNGKRLTTWYSGAAACSGSRAAILTGRQYTRIGLPIVLGATRAIGLPKNETTIATLLRGVGYKTGVVGKWHLGQRHAYLPASHGFDDYLGIPYSPDMGLARLKKCYNKKDHNWLKKYLGVEATFEYQHDYTNESNSSYDLNVPKYPLMLPLVSQSTNSNGTVVTKIVSQPLEFRTLPEQYANFARNFIRKNAREHFFLYVPFSHVHTTTANALARQYVGCKFEGATPRGIFGDALLELDWIVGQIVEELEQFKLMENTLIIFTSDNGPWSRRYESAGTVGTFRGAYAKSDFAAKLTTWEGGLRMPAFVHWRGEIRPHSRSSSVVSSLDVFPTVATIAGVDKSTIKQKLDGLDVSKVWFSNEPFDTLYNDRVLFFYHSIRCTKGPNAARIGPYKVHWATNIDNPATSGLQCYPDVPLIFNVEKDPEERYPLTQNNEMPTDKNLVKLVKYVQRKYKDELESFTWGVIKPEPDEPDEIHGEYDICCDRTKSCVCDGALNYATFATGAEFEVQ